jgi:NTE family protein
MHGINSYRNNPDFKGDLIVIEPTEYDAEFFDMNPMAFWERRKAAKRGFLSVKASIHNRYPELKRILGAYGIRVNEEFAQVDPDTPQLNPLPMACAGPVE